MDGVRVEVFGGGEVEDLWDELLALYALSYSGPPWLEGPDEVDAYGRRILDWGARSGFAGVMARDERGALVGVAYGWPGPAVTNGVPMPGVDAPEPFNVGDLMVHPDARRRGLGRQLLDQLTEARRPAALLTHPDGEARQLYERAGWRLVGEVTPPDSITWLVYVLDAPG